MILAHHLQADSPLEIDSLEKDYAAQLPHIPATEPSDAIDRFQIDETFRIELVVTEPMVTDPIAMAFDEFGSMFVVQMGGYSEDGDKNLGQIRLLQDTDSNGTIDHGQTFVDGLSWPTAIACYNGGIYVGAPPDIWYFKDTDNDGKVDLRKRVFHGFARNNVQGMMNSLCWGVDGWLYGSSSTNGGNIKMLDYPNAPEIQLRRNDFLIDARTNKLFRVTGGGQHGLSFDRWGDRFLSSNSDHIQWVRFEDRYLSRNPFMNRPKSTISIAADGPAAEVFRTSPNEPWRVVRTRLRAKKMVTGLVEGGGRPSGYFTGASGVTIYRGDAFPHEFQDSTYAFVGDVGSNLVHCKKVIDDGLSKSAIRVHPKTEFLTSSDNWFRPVQFANGPDGALYILDMYRETIEHPLSLPPLIKKHLDLTSGRDRGRIYRVLPRDQDAPKRPMPGVATDEQLVRMLGHANGWHRETATRLLIERNALEQSKTLKEFIGSSVSPEGTIRALHVLSRLDQIDESTIRQALSAKHPRVREHAVRIAEMHLAKFPNLLASLSQMTTDPDIGVVEQLALSAGEITWKARQPILMNLIRKHGSNDELMPAIHSSIAGHQIDLMQGLLEVPLNRSHRSLMLDLGRQILRQNREQEIRSLMHLLTTSRDDAFETSLLPDLLAMTELRHERLTTFLSTVGIGNPVSLIAKVIDDSRAIAVDTERTTSDRVAAILRMRIADLPSIRTTCAEMLSLKEPTAIQSAVISLLETYDSPDIANVLLDHLTTLTPSAANHALGVVLSKESWVAILLNGLESKSVAIQAISTQDRQKLLNHTDPNTKRRSIELFGTTSDRTTVVNSNRGVLQMAGNKDRGRNLFREKCSTCHRMGDQGHDIGPKLEPLRNRGAEFFLTNILDPNREVDPRYFSSVVTTHDGRSLSGIVESETDRTITIAISDGTTKIVDRTNIDEIHPTGRSLMPEGFEKDLDEQTLADLISFILSEEA